MKIDRKPTRRFDMLQNFTITLRKLVEVHKAYSPQEAVRHRGHMASLMVHKPRRNNVIVKRNRIGSSLKVCR